jgi:hypothetical protein
MSHPFVEQIVLITSLSLRDMTESKEHLALGPAKRMLNCVFLTSCIGELIAFSRRDEPRLQLSKSRQCSRLRNSQLYSHEQSEGT